jgi:capsular exopolysaccharide synthesis family protein
MSTPESAHRAAFAAAGEPRVDPGGYEAARPAPGVGAQAPDGGEPAPPAGGPRELARVVRARRWLVLLVTLAAAGAALALSLAADEHYESSATLLFGPPATADFLGPGVGDEPEPERAAATRAELLTLDAVARRAARALGAGFTEERVAESVSVDARKGADVAEVTATAGDPREAARIANAYAREFIAFRRDADRTEITRGIARLREELARIPFDEENRAARASLQARLADLRAALPLQTGNAEVVESAEPAGRSDRRNVERNVALGGVLGLLLALGLAWVLERADRRVKTVEELEELYELPVLARIPRSRQLRKGIKRGAAGDLLKKASGFTMEAEAFRMLRAALRYFNVDRDIRSILVVSPMPNDGKSTVARVLAASMATMGDRVVLVDADLRRHAGAPRDDEVGEGLSLVLAGFDLDDALTEVDLAFDPLSEEPRSMAELPSGPSPPNPAELLESERMGYVLRELEASFDVVIIDTPALGSVSDALALVPKVSAVLIVSGLNQTTRNAALALRREIAMLGARPVGVVANFATSEDEADTYGYYR